MAYVGEEGDRGHSRWDGDQLYLSRIIALAFSVCCSVIGHWNQQ
jgi:hypothetical protein